LVERRQLREELADFRTSESGHRSLSRTSSSYPEERSRAVVVLELELLLELLDPLELRLRTRMCSSAKGEYGHRR
jgi:hypothetical protein